ncbi:methyl-accepting chemotaxis protein [Methylobacterium sp. JK268]
MTSLGWRAPAALHPPPLRPLLAAALPSAAGLLLGGAAWAAGLADLGPALLAALSAVGGATAAIALAEHPRPAATARPSVPVEAPPIAVPPIAVPLPAPRVAEAEALAGLAPFFTIADAQLRSIADQTEAAASGILAQLRALDDAVTQAAAFTGRTRERMVGLVQAGDASFDALARALRAYLEERLEATLREREQIRAISDQLAGLGSLTTTLDGLGRAIAMLAMNASIEAVRAGEQGAGFRVIAGELRALAQSSQQMVTEAGRTVSSIGAAVEANWLASRTDERVRGEQERLRALLAEVEGLAASRADSAATAAQAELGEIDARNRAIGMQVLEVCGQVQFQDVVRQQVEAVAAAVATLHRYLDEVGSALVDRADPASLRPDTVVEGLRAGYVTAIQHNRDAAVSGGIAVGPASPAIELF